MIKAIVFDIGGVILDAHALIEDLQKWFKPKDNLIFWEELNLKLAPLCKGEGTLHKTMTEFAKEKNIKIPDSVLKELFLIEKKHLKFNNGVIKLIKSLKENYRLGIISNTIEEHAIELRKLELFEYFELVILSHEIKMSKHELDIFQHLIKEMDLKPNEIVFIDDVQKYAPSYQDFLFPPNSLVFFQI